ncbi:Flp family type IVb pilin [Halocynthiibacter styelae]|uniref:Pilus assembly protein n=1 Tax=Halocynthiibacter styelae TaxID=2761955 RepID=A0A8J7LPE5_9RHOB|nr:hypothetical protein [Paenihalocynthiibacter styelae]MBI1493466.1 hypothetical protein [Paenihalocynthiibacter styelae]
MLHLFRNFLDNESGAVTVDWVVLTAGIVMMGAVFAIPIGNDVSELSRETGTAIGSMSVATY